MNYSKHYENLISTRKNRGLSRETGFEIHHIIPRCIGGSDSKNNLVKLTYREHLLAHYLLIKIYPYNTKLLYAFSGMNFNPKVSTRYTERLRQTNSIRMKTNNPMYNEASRKKMSDTRKYLFKEGKLVPRKIPEKEQEGLSARMKVNNPMSKEPWKNHTAAPVRIYWADGSIEDFKYIKEITITKGIPYATLKYISTHNTSSTKWGILKMEKLNESNTTNSRTPKM